MGFRRKACRSRYRAVVSRDPNRENTDRTNPLALEDGKPREPQGLYGEQSPAREVVGIGVFLREQDVPRFPSWPNQAEAPLLRVVLREVLPGWLEREPDNPYVAVFAPLLIEDDDSLRARAPELWRTVCDAPLAPEVREVLGQVMEFWYFERFRGLTAKEIWAMLNLITPIQETRAYQSIYAEGKAEGKASTLKRLLARRFKVLPPWAATRIDAATLPQLETWLDGIFDADSIEALIGAEQD